MHADEWRDGPIEGEPAAGGAPGADAGGPDPDAMARAGASEDPAADAPGVPDPPDVADSPEPAESREGAYALLQRGQALMQERHHAQAAIVLERAARLEPRKGSILEALGRAYYNSGQHARSAETFRALLEIDPSAHYAHYALGQSLKQLRRLREARTHLRLAVALAPDSPLYRGALARLPSAESR